MKNKLVIWGTNAENEKVLIALELQAQSNKVLLYAFPEAIANDDFTNKMMNNWRNGAAVPFPEGHTTLERELSVTESLLPDDLKVERGDLIQRAQTEWHFAVLSAKLHAAYQQELADFKEKIEALTSYDNKMWDNLRAFWDKVQNQSRERNLYREHADQLRDNINVLFEDLKKIRSRVQKEFISASAGVYEEFSKSLDDIEARIAAGGSKLHSIFDELKQLQNRYRDARMSNEHRNQVWDRIDGAFKKAKERKFGPSVNEGALAERHERRLGGLTEALKRMQDSVRRDEEELAFQRKKVNDSEGQLEAQIRMAKIKMIEERLVSKREKLNEMSQTRSDVERQASTAKDKEAKRLEKEEERKKLEAARQTAKSEIAASIRSKRETPRQEEEEGSTSLFESATTVLGDILMDALDTAKAVATVVTEKAGDAYEKAADKAEVVYDQVVDKAGEVYEKTADKAEAVYDQVVDKAGEVYEKTAEKAAAVYDQVVDKAGEAYEKTAEKAAAVYDQVVDKAGEVYEKTAEKAEVAYDKVVEKAGQVKEALSKSDEPAVLTAEEAPVISAAETTQPIPEAEIAETPPVAETPAISMAETQQVEEDTPQAVSVIAEETPAAEEMLALTAEVLQPEAEVAAMIESPDAAETEESVKPPEQTKKTEV